VGEIGNVVDQSSSSQIYLHILCGGYLFDKKNAVDMRLIRLLVLIGKDACEFSVCKKSKISERRKSPKEQNK
jgi:hypothetical protein